VQLPNWAAALSAASPTHRRQAAIRTGKRQRCRRLLAGHRQRVRTTHGACTLSMKHATATCVAHGIEEVT
jgi:hypothetical protein